MIIIPDPPDPRPWTPAGCTFLVAPGKPCGTEFTATLDGINGRRCVAHPPSFDPVVAVELHRDGWPSTALAYLRWSS